MRTHLRRTDTTWSRLVPEMITIAHVQVSGPSDQCPMAFVERTRGVWKLAMYFSSSLLSFLRKLFNPSLSAISTSPGIVRS